MSDSIIFLLILLTTTTVVTSFFLAQYLRKNKEKGNEIKKLERDLLQKSVRLDYYTDKVNEISSYVNMNLSIGAKFRFPPNGNFVDRVRGKRAEIIDIKTDGISCRLINDSGRTIGNNVWHIDGKSLTYLVFENGGKLKHNFISYGNN